MSESAAPEEKLGELHSLIADTLIQQLSDFDHEEGLDPRILSSAISFLRDNKIKANPFLDEKVSEIEQRLKDRTRRFQVVPGDAAERASNG